MARLFGGTLTGGAIDIVAGVAMVDVTSEGSGKRDVLQGLAILVSLVGGMAVSGASRDPGKPLQ